MRRALIATGLLLAAAHALPAAASHAPAGDDFNLPDLGQPADAAMTLADEKRLGAQVVSQLRGQDQTIDDPELEDYVNHIGSRLGRHTDPGVNGLHFSIIRTDDVNGFALPGGYIGINAGLIMATQTESQLASVMAHEIGHVVQRHIARQMAESKGDTIANLATAIVGAIIGAAAGGGDAAMAAIMGGMSHMGMQQLSYSRADEKEADRVGIRDLASSGYDPHAMAQFFGILQRQSDLYGQEMPQILLSHPVTSARMADAEARASDYPHAKIHTSPEYPYMRARARVLAADSTEQVKNYFRNQLRSDHPTPADRYGYALALSHIGQTQQAIRIMRAGLQAHADILAWHMGLAQTLNQGGQYGEAHRQLTSALQRFPHSQALKLAYAQNLQDQGQSAAMRDYLLSQSQVLDTYPSAQELLARGAAHQKRLGEAYYRQARYFAMLDDYPNAINQLRTALQTLKLSHYDKSRLSALRDQMTKACQRAWSAEQCRRGVTHGNDY